MVCKVLRNDYIMPSSKAIQILLAFQNVIIAYGQMCFGEITQISLSKQSLHFE